MPKTSSASKIKLNSFNDLFGLNESMAGNRLVRNMTDDEATVVMVDSNIQRENILPSEKAKAYKMKYDAIKHQGAKGNSLKTMSEQAGESAKKVQRYIWIARLNDECILFVRGEEPLRDKKWYPWEHEEYKRAIEYVKAIRKNEDEETSSDEYASVEQKREEDNCTFINEDSLKYMKKQAKAGENISIKKMDTYDFMMFDFAKLTDSEEGVSEGEMHNVDSLIDIARLQEMQSEEKKGRYEQRRQEFLDNYDEEDLFSVYVSEFISDTRRQVIKELSRGKNKAEDKVIMKIVDPRGTEEEMMEKKRVWEEMRNI